jgi:hypothetical protein
MAIKYIKFSREYTDGGILPLPWDFPTLSEGWVWNGYYTRLLISPVLNFFGKIAFRVAYNKLENRHHAFIPAFIIPGLNTTIYDLKILLESFLSCFLINDAIEKYSSSSSQEYFDLPVSTAYFRLAWFIRKCRTWLGMVIETNSIQELKKFSLDVVQKFILDLHARAPS